MTRTRAGILASLAGFLLWIYVVSTTRVWWIGPSYEFGLFQILPLWFWIALALHLLGIWLMLDNTNEQLFLIQALMLSFMIWGTPILVEPHTRQPDSWIHLGATKLILDSAHIRFSTEWGGYLAAEHQWPGSFILGATVLSISGLPAEHFLGFMHLLSSAAFTIMYYVLARNALDRVFVKLSVVGVLFLNLWLNFYYGPQGLAIMLLPLFFLCMSRSNLKFRILGILIFSTLIITHSVTVLFVVLLSIASLALSRALRVSTGHEVLVVGLYASLFAAWLIYNANLYLTPFVYLGFRNILFGPWIEYHSEYFGRSVAELIRYCTIATMLIWASLHLLRIRKEKSHFSFLASWIGAGLFLIALDFRQLASFEYLTARGLGFLFLIVPLIIALSLQSWKRFGAIKEHGARVCVVVLVVLMIVNVSTLYYAENDWIMSDSTLAEERFLSDHSGAQRVVGPFRQAVVFLYQTRIEPTPLASAQPVATVLREMSRFDIVSYDAHTDMSSPRREVFSAMYAQFFDSYSPNLVYNNGDSKLYHRVE